MSTLQQAQQILGRLGDELRRRYPEVRTLDEAYRGKHRIAFSSDEFKEYFESRYKNFSDNWVQIVADAPVERLQITGFSIDGEADDQLWRDWVRNDAQVWSDAAFLDAIVAKRSYSLVWGDRDGSPRLTWEHPSQAIVFYDPETRERTSGAKIWRDDTTEYATLYLPDQVWKFQRPHAGEVRIDSGLHVPDLGRDWQPRQPASDDTWPIRNPYGKVPLVEWQNRPRLIGEPVSDVAGTLSMQNSINLLWMYLFAVADRAPLPMKVIMGQQRPTEPVLDEDGQEVGRREVDLRKWSVDRVQWLEDPTAKIGEWSAADFSKFADIIETAVGHIAAQTRTPQHYLIGKMANLSGDALIAAESGLVNRTREKTAHFGLAARDTAELLALTRDDTGRAEAIRASLTPVAAWQDVEVRSDSQVADAALKDRQIGLPLRYILEKRYDLAPGEVDRIMQLASQEASDPTLERIAQELTGGGAAGGE